MSVTRQVSGWLLAAAFVLSGVGCGSSSDSKSSSGGGASMDGMAAQLEVQEAARQKEQARLDAEKKAQEEAAAAAAAPPERKVAGRSKVGEGGYYTAIIGARRHILNEAESWAWKQAVNSFRAEHGRKPKDHDEFMKEIVKRYEIDLGYKEENQEFLYDPAAESDGDFGVLYVVEKEPVQETEPEQK